MLAAEFGYSFDYVDWCIDTDDLIAHMEYRKDHPTAGSVLMAVIKSFDKDDKTGVTSKPKKERTPEEQLQLERAQLKGLISDFGPLQPKPKRKLVDYVC